MAIAVDIYVKDTAVSPLPISGVIVNVYDASTLAQVASGTTNSSGDASFLLPGVSSPGTSYEVRLFKLGVLFSNPVLISVMDPLPVNQTNVFDVSGTLLTLPVAADPRCCRCTGYLKDFGNRPVSNALFRVMARADFALEAPKVVDSNLISPEVANFHTDTNGKLSFDLLRGGRYYITYSGDDDTVWSIVVPDRPSVNLIDLIHPQPVVLTWDTTVAPGNAVTIHIGQTLQVPFTVTFSDYEVVNTDLGKWVSLMNSNGAIMDLSFLSSTASAIVTGSSVGAATVTVSLLPDLLPIRVPAYSLTAPTLNVTVIT